MRKTLWNYSISIRLEHLPAAITVVFYPEYYYLFTRVSTVISHCKFKATTYLARYLARVINM